MKRHFGLSVSFLWAALGLALSSVVGAADPQGSIFAVIEENDLLSNPFTKDHQDRHYTHGMKFVYLRIIRTEEFRGQIGNDVFGPLMVKGKFAF